MKQKAKGKAKGKANVIPVRLRRRKDLGAKKVCTVTGVSRGAV